MSRIKKSRSMKRVTGGVKTGSKERTKLEKKQRKAAKSKHAQDKRQKSVYQKFLDDNNLVEQQHVQKQPNPSEDLPEIDSDLEETEEQHERAREEKPQSLWEQLERPQNKDTF